MSGLRVAVDARPLDLEWLRAQGIGRYAHGLLSHLPRVAAEHGGEVVQLRAGNAPGAFGPDSGAPALRVRRPPVPARLAELPEQALLPLDVRRARAGVHHSLSIYRAPLRAGVPTVVTLHDVVPLMWPEQYLRTGLAHRLLYRAARRAAALIAVSHRAREDAVRHLDVEPERVTVVPEAAGEHFVPTDPGPARERLGLTGPYLLYVGGLTTLDPRKNVEQLVEGFASWARARSRPETLVLAGGTGPDAEALVARSGDRVLLAGFVEEGDLPGLYSGARCLVTASRYEGFGLPALEALACGTPVAGYEAGALPEVAGPGAVLVPEGDSAALFRAVERICDEPALRERLSEAGREHAAQFSWRRCAEETWEVYERVAATASAQSSA